MTGPMSSQGTKIYLSAPIVTETITAVTKAVPVVLSVANSVAVVGDIVGVQGTGFASIDNKLWEVAAKTAASVTLKDADTSSEPGAATATGKLLTGGALIEICVASLTRDSPAAATLDVTTLCDTERQQRTGMKNNGTWTAQGFYDSGSTGQERLQEAYDDGQQRLMQIDVPDQSKILYYTQVNQFGESFAVDQPVQITTGGIVMGKVSYLPPPVP